MGKYVNLAEKALRSLEAKRATAAVRRDEISPGVAVDAPTDPAVAVQSSALQPPEACSECGSRVWTVSLVDDTGHRVCHDCITGMTALRANGVPI